MNFEGRTHLQVICKDYKAISDYHDSVKKVFGAARIELLR